MRQKRNAFTLVEILVVIAIIALIGSFALPTITKRLGFAKKKLVKSKMVLIEGALDQFMLDCGRYPTDEEGLDALLVVPAEDLEEKWTSPYLKKSQLLDPWGNPYMYFAEGVVNIGSYDLMSYGADSAEGGEGDNEDVFND
ncbi:MAG: type II secretion system protein GspG [Planctomycetes bacterium]|nr:type II secretion system protein GspG [Planctomycetota bacterium]